MRISFLNFAVGSLALCLLSATALAQQTPSADSQTPSASTEATPPSQPAAAAATAEVAAPVVMPPASPVVTFDNGQLTVMGNNGTLSDILNAIQQKTGAVIESAAGMSTETVIGQYGPASPATVIAELLNGTSLNYVLVGSSDGGQLAKVLLSIRPAHVAVQTADEGGRRHRRGLAEAAALEAQPDLPQSDVIQAAMDSNSHHRRRHAGNDVVPDSTDKTTAGNTSTDGSTPAADPNTTASAADAIGATGLAPGSPILPSDAPANIMKAIQHGPGRSPSASAGNSGFGPTPSSLGTSAPIPSGSGSTYTLPNGAIMLGPGIPLPNGAIFFPGGANIPLH